MAQWRKVIVSGSAAELSSLTLDTALPVAQGGIGATSLTDKAVLISQDSGTDAVGALALTTNGSIVVGGTNGPAVEAASDVAGTGLTAVTGDGTLVINVDAAQTQITSVGTLDGGAISSGFGNIDNGTSTLNTGNATVNNFTNDSAVADSHITGSITGSFTGDGSGLTGVGAASLDIDSFSAGTALHQTQDHFLYSDNGTEKKITFSDVEDAIFGNVSGDASIAAGGALTIAAGSVEESMLDGGIGIFSGSAQIDHDSTTNFVANEHIDHSGVSITSGNGLTGGGNITSTRTLAVGAGDGITVNADDVAVTAAQTAITSILNASLTKIGTNGSQEYITFGTSNEVNTFVNNTERLSVTSAGVDITGTLAVSSNLTVEGNLDVNGTLTTIDSTNLKVADQFILAASGSNNSDGGLIVETNGAGSGTAFAWDNSANRWGFSKADDTAQNATSVAPRQYSVTVSGSAASPSGNPSDFGASDATRIGMMHVNTSNGEIWIYS